MRTVTATISAWATSSYGTSPDDLKNDHESSLINRFGYSTSDMSYCGWVKVGEAEITVTLLSTDQIVTGQVEALKAEKQKVIADAEVQANEIEQRIQSLLAISFDG